MKINLTEKAFTLLGVLNFLLFMYYLIFGEQGGWFIVHLPNEIGEWILFYCPILFTIVCLSCFLIQKKLEEKANWFWFFILSISYLPIVIFVTASYHIPAH